ncbi:unnamed protein product, partial [Rotaria socialis]
SKAAEYAKAKKEAEDNAKAEKEAEEKAKAEKEAEDKAKAVQDAKAKKVAEAKIVEEAKAKKAAEEKAKSEKQAEEKGNAGEEDKRKKAGDGKTKPMEEFKPLVVEDENTKPSDEEKQVKAVDLNAIPTAEVMAVAMEEVPDKIVEVSKVKAGREDKSKGGDAGKGKQLGTSKPKSVAERKSLGMEEGQLKQADEKKSTILKGAVDKMDVSTVGEKVGSVGTHLFAEDTEKKSVKLSTEAWPSTIVEETAVANKIKSEGLGSSKTSLATAIELPQIEAVKVAEIVETTSPESLTSSMEHDYLRPNFTLRLKPTVVVNDGEKLKLEVRFIAQPEPTITWYFKTGVLKPSSNVHIDQLRDVHMFSSILTIDKVTMEYDGKFKVVLKNELGEIISGTQVNVKRSSKTAQTQAPTKKISTSEVPSLSSDELLLTTASGSQGDIMSSELAGTTLDRRTSTLGIPEGKPTFTQPLESELLINEDEQLVLQCTISGNPLPQLIWLFNDRKVIAGNDYQRNSEQLNPHSVRHQLIISPKQKKIGVYKAQAQNTYGHTICTCSVKKSAHAINQQKKAAFGEAELQIPAAPPQRRRSSAASPANVEQTQNPILVQGLSILQIDLGSPCALTCKSKYDTEQQWFKDGQPIIGTKPTDNIFTKTDRTNDGNIHVLNIKRFQQENIGNYELVLKNSLGQINSQGQLEMKGILPAFTLEPKSAAVVKGKLAEFNCRVSGSPKPEVQWFLNDKLLQPSSRVSIVEERGLIILRINNITDADTGTIKCLVKNALAEIKSEVQLLITGEQRAPKIIDKSRPTSANAGESVELFVKISGAPVPTVTWTRKGMTISSNELYELRSDNETYYLLIKKAVADVVGTYVITAVNTAGKATADIDLTITGLSTLFERPLRDISVSQGRLFALDCEVNTKKGVPTIVWMKDNQPIVKSDRITPSVKGNKVHVLTIKQALPSDTGYYSIKATLGNEVSTSDAQVLVEIPPTIVKIPDAITIVDGQDCEIDIEVTGLPSPIIKWSHLAQDLKTNAKYKITSDGNHHQLRIQRATVDDAGEYQVMCSNNIGRTTGKITVQISSPPAVVEPLKDLFVPIKRSARLETHIYAFPVAKATWSKNAIPIDFSLYGARIVAEEKRGIYSLVIKNIQLDDGGFYVCTAQNSFGQVKTSATLTIEMAPIFLHKLDKLEGVENCDIDIRVQVAGYPKPKIDFAFNQNTLDLRGRYALKELKDGWYVFTISNTKRSDAGSYTCTATNSLGQASCIGKLTLFQLAAPNFTKTLTDALFPVGGILKTDLKVSGLPLPRLTWLKDGQVFDENDRISIVFYPLTATWTLTIRECQESDSGSYECRAKNPGGEKTTQCQITVSGEAPAFIDSPEKVSCLEGQTAVFGCRVSGDPNPMVVWSRGKGKQFTENTQKYALYYDEELDAHFFEINQYNEADTGIYTVTAQNIHGTITKPVSCFLATKPEEVIDYKSVLRKMEALVKAGQGGPDWGKLRKGKAIAKGPADPGWQYKLKHFELMTEAQLAQYNQAQPVDLIGLPPGQLGARLSRGSLATGEGFESDDGLGLNVPTPPGGAKGRKTSRMGLVTFTKQLSNVAVHEGKHATFECSISDVETPVTWLFNDKPIPAQRAQTLAIGKTRRLNIKECLLSENHSTVTCVLDEATKTSAQLVVEEEAFEFTDKLKNLKIKRGDICELNCTVNKPNITLQWFKDGNLITNIKEEINGLVHKLIITNADVNDKGVYVAKYLNAQTEGNVEVLGAPQIVKPPTNSILLLGQSVVLTAEITSNLKPIVTWLFKGQPIKSSATKHQIEAKKDGIYTLTILRGDAADEGLYSVVAENSVDKAQADATVNVCSKPKIDKLADVALNIGENLRVTCQYSGRPAPTITWYKDGQVIPADDQRIRITQESATLSVLTINNANLNDTGVYSVKLQNIAGEVEGKSNVNVKPTKPTLTRDLNPTYVGVKNEDLILSIAGTGNPYPTCQWFKNNTELTQSSDERIEFKEDKTTNEFFIIIKNTNQHDIAEYQAQLTNAAGLIKSKKSKISIQKQPVFVRKPQTTTANLAETCQIECEIDALPHAKVTWLIGGKPVSMKDGYETTFDAQTGIATLIIRNVATKHAGSVTVKAENTIGTTEEIFNINIRSTPILLKPLTDTEVLTNNDATLTCAFQSSPQATIQWFHNGQPLALSPNKYDISYDSTTNQHKLIIKNALLEDHGTYSVQATNELGQTQTEAKLHVVNAPIFVDGLQDQSVAARQSIELYIKVLGTPQPTTTWYKAGKEIKSDEKKYSIVPIDTEGNAKLIIKDVGEEDQNFYTCVAKNKIGTNQTEGHLKVLAPLQFIQPLKDQDLLALSSCVLTVEVNGIPKPTVKWFFNDQEIKNTPKSKIETKQNVHTLSLPKVDLPEDGIYKCVATNADGSVETQAHLSVCTKPKVEGKANDVTAQISQSPELHTAFSGLPKPTVTWYKGNDLTNPIQSDDNIEISELPDGTQVLKVKKADVTDSAVYTARATNKVGTVDSKINLVIKEIKPHIISDITNMTAIRDEPIEFTIKAAGNPQPTIRWFKNETEEILSTNQDFEFIQDASTDTFMLKIHKCKPEHQGDYSALLTNTGGSAKSKKGKLIVTKVPEFLEKPTSVDANENDLAEFHAKVDAFPAAKITWLFEGKPVSVKEGFDVHTDQATGTSVLTIKQALPKHIGKISVKAENASGSVEETVQCSVKTGPKITKKPTDIEALLHTDAVFLIDVSGSPKPEVEWIHLGQTVIPSGKYEIIEGDATVTKLIIHDVTPEDESPIQIKVKNSLGQTEATVQLKALETPRIEPQLTDQQVTLSDTLTLKTNVYGRPNVDIQWLKDQKPISSSDRIKIERNNNECSLTIENIKEEDIGAYVLSVKNKLGKVDTTSNVKVTAPLNFTKPLDDLDIIQGSNGVLSVDCGGVPKPKLTWYFNGNEIKSNQKTRIETKGSTSILTINKADMIDIGVYKVVADNGKETAETQANIDVCVKPKVEGKLTDATCILNETAKLSVKFSAVPTAVITWYKADGTEITPDDRIQIVNDDHGQSTLTVNKTVSQDAQAYIARAVNKVGSVDAKINLNIKEVKPALKHDIEPQTINVGDELVYRLLVGGRPLPTVKFFKDGNEIGPITVEESSTTDDSLTTAVLRIPHAALTDQGEYQASIENSAGVVKTKKVKVTVQQTPTFLKTPEDASVSQGKEVTYEAQISAHPTAKVTWSLNGKSLTPNADCAIAFDNATQKASLTLRKIDVAKHTGKITCQVENPAGKVTHDAKLSVFTQPKLLKPLQDESIVEGQDTTLSIEAIGYPSPNIQWFFNDQLISPTDQHYQIVTKEEEHLYELKIKQTKSTDIGTYKVVLTNSEGEIASQANLNVQLAPVISSLEPKIEGIQGQQVIISCQVSGNPKPEITFLKDKKDVTTLEDKNRFQIEYDEKTDEVRLIISNVKDDDHGKYTVQAKNPVSTIEEQTTVTIAAQLAFTEGLQDTDVISGQNLTLTCHCQGIPKPTVKWYQNEHEIKSTTKQKIESKPDDVHTLTVNRVDLTDGGVFKVVATNPQGSVTSTCNVTVLMKPKIESKQQDIQVTIGEPAQFSAKISGLPKPTIQWFKNGQPFDIDNERIKTVENDDVYSLVFESTQIEDKASYTFKATNRAGDIESPKMALNVTTTQPKIRLDLQPTLNVTKNESIVLTIQADGKPKPHIQWFKGTEEISRNQTGVKIIEEGDNTYKLIIEQATENDHGEYSAIIQNAAGQVKSKKTNVVVTKSPEFLSKPTDTTFRQGDTGTIECQVDGFPLPKITLLHNGKPLTPKDGIEHTYDAATHRLIITVKNARFDQAGIITCKLENTLGSTEASFQFNVTAGPSITKGLTDQECVLGKEFRLSLTTSANPKPTVKWFKDNVELQNMGTQASDDTYELVIPNVKLEDEGIYKAVVANDIGDRETQCKLTVTQPSELKCDFTEQQIIALGQTIHLSCQVSGRPQPDVIWTKDGKEIKASDRVEIIKNVDGTCSLTIKQATSEDKGVYKVICKNKLQTREAQTQVQITSALRFNASLKDNITQVGQSVIFEIDCEGLPKPTIKWLFNGQEINASPKYKIESKGNVTKLTLSKVDLVDSGLYEAIVSNGIDTINTQSKLDVCVKPKVEGKPSDVNVHVNESAKLQCKISGSPSPTIVWLKDGQPIEQSDNITIQSEPDGTQTLLVKSTQITDKGSYVCQATNIGGTVDVKLNLNVQQVKPTLKSDLMKDIVALADEPVALTIQAAGTKPKVKWYKDGEEIIETVEEEYEIIEEEETYTLLIKRAQPKDSGEYQAVITNDAGQVKSKKIKVQIQKAAHLKKKPEPIVTVKQGEQARFECEFVGNPSPKVSWLRDGKPLTPKDGFEIKTDTTTGTSVLVINQTTTKHSGPITLRLENSAGPPIEEIIQLQVETAPQLLQKPQAVTEAHLNQTASIAFKCLSTPKPVIHLFRNDDEIQLTDEHYEIVINPTDLTSYEIKIKNVQIEDEGNYRIYIENSLGNIESNFQLATIDNVSIKSSAQPINTDLKQHDTLVLEYTVSGRPKPDVVFMKDGKEIKASAKTQITYDETTNIYRLITTDVGQDDQGVYTLVAKNKLGRQESEPVKINVTAPLTIKRQLPGTVDCIFNEQTTLTIEAEGIPQPKITWLFNDQPLKSSPKHKIETSKENPRLTTLTITKLDHPDDGKYTAIIDNGLEKVQSDCQLHVYTKPKLESKLDSTFTFNYGEPGLIPLHISGDDNTITWLKDSHPIELNDRVRFITEENNLYKLVIDDVRSEDKGIYTIQVKNKGGLVELKTTVNVKEQKPQILFDLNDAPGINVAKIGEEFSLEIQAQGKPAPHVAWLFNGQELSTDSTDYELIATEDGHYRLVFHQFNEHYLGEYQAIITSSAGTIKTKKVKVTGQQIPFFTQELPQFVQVKTGEKLTIECTTKGYPPPKVSWSLNGKILTNKDGYDIKFDQATGHATFIIPNATMKHIGKYECKIENQYGTHATEINIDVLAPPNVQQKMQDFEICRGQEVTITVTADGSPLPTCTWLYNDTPIQVQPDHIEIINDGPVHSLRILNAELTDEGQYKAVIENQMGKTELVSQVTVMDAPDIASEPAEIRINQGGSCKLQCHASGKPLPEVKWTKNGKEIKSTEHLLLESLPDGIHYLTLTDAQADHSGQYIANVKHKVRTQQMIFNIIVTAPLTLKQTPSDVNVLQTQNAQIALEFEGLPRPNITWLFNGNPIQPSAKYKVEMKGNQFILNVNKTDFADSGIYTAIIDNGIEKLEVPVNMHIGVKPKVEAPKPANDQTCTIGQDTQISWKFSGIEKP